MSTTSIEWTAGSDGSKGQTWNPVAGCEAVSPGCANCYAKTMTRRLEAMGQADYSGLTTDKHFNGVVRSLPHKLDIPLKRRKPTTYFVNSMSDLFHEDVPDEFIDKVFAVMALCPQHTFQVLTKRAERMARYMTADRGPFRFEFEHTTSRDWIDAAINEFPSAPNSDSWPKWQLRNVWLGVSCEDQKRKSRIDTLRTVPASVRFLSLEPLLEDLGELDLSGIDWVIVGGESGGGARPCNLEWVRSIVEQCKAASVSIFCKQLGSSWARTNNSSDKKGGQIQDWPAELQIREFPNVSAARRSFSLQDHGSTRLLTDERIGTTEISQG